MPDLDLSSLFPGAGQEDQVCYSRCCITPYDPKVSLVLQPLAGGNEDDLIDENYGPQEHFEVGFFLSRVCPAIQDASVRG